MEENHMRNLLVAQSGGPTAAINATVAGVVSCAVLSGKVDHIYGAVNGIEGVLAEKFLDLGKKLDSAEKISLLMQTPAAALGSCRYKLGDPEENKEDFEEILQIFRRHEIRYFIYIGGNDSMDTVDKMSKYCKENGVDDVFVVGAPKTIDNDLVETDHCPGFGSAAKYLAATFAELERDCHVYEKKAVIIKKEGKTAILVTHDISEAISMADRVIVLAARPAYVKKKIPIRFAMEERTPMKARSAPEFKTYFNAIWKELNENA